jgi:hypothetical protein
MTTPTTRHPSAYPICPECGDADDVPDWQPTSETPLPLAGCTRCPFTFPILPGPLGKDITITVIRDHGCAQRDHTSWHDIASHIRAHGAGIPQITAWLQETAATIAAHAPSSNQARPQLRAGGYASSFSMISSETL